MRKPLAIALSGGGARGALQVGALQALLEEGIKPDILVGSSAGAINATYLAVHGVSLSTIANLKNLWLDVSKTNPLPENYLWLTVRSLFNRPAETTVQCMEFIFRTHGLTPDFHFYDIQGVRLYLVAADLVTGRLVIFGNDPKQSVYTGLLASTALPPWVKPIEQEGQMLIDGGVVSNLPVEPAIRQGAREIIALEMDDVRGLDPTVRGFGPFVTRLIHTIEHRQVQVELALAKTLNIPVHYLNLNGERSVPLWDFHHTAELIEKGYAITRQEISQWKRTPKSTLFSRIREYIQNINSHPSP